METVTDTEYQELERYLLQAQEEIGQALEDLTKPAGGNTLDVNANTGQKRQINGSQEIQLPNGPVSSQDFLSIFAAHNLIQEREPIEVKVNHWSKTNTLPSPKNKKLERPKTLTPPPNPSSNHKYKNQNWKFYVHGNFKPIHSHTVDVKKPQIVKPNTNHVVKPWPESKKTVNLVRECRDNHRRPAIPAVSKSHNVLPTKNTGLCHIHKDGQSAFSPYVPKGKGLGVNGIFRPQSYPASHHHSAMSDGKTSNIFQPLSLVKTQNTAGQLNGGAAAEQPLPESQYGLECRDVSGSKLNTALEPVQDGLVIDKSGCPQINKDLGMSTSKAGQVSYHNEQIMDLNTVPGEISDCELELVQVSMLNDVPGQRPQRDPEGQVVQDVQPRKTCVAGTEPASAVSQKMRPPGIQGREGNHRYQDGEEHQGRKKGAATAPVPPPRTSSMEGKSSQKLISYANPKDERKDKAHSVVGCQEGTASSQVATLVAGTQHSLTRGHISHPDINIDSNAPGPSVTNSCMAEPVNPSDQRNRVDCSTREEKIKCESCNKARKCRSANERSQQLVSGQGALTVIHPSTGKERKLPGQCKCTDCMTGSALASAEPSSVVHAGTTADSGIGDSLNNTEPDVCWSARPRIPFSQSFTEHSYTGHADTGDRALGARTKYDVELQVRTKQTGEVCQRTPGQHTGLATAVTDQKNPAMETEQTENLKAKEASCRISECLKNGDTCNLSHTGTSQRAPGQLYRSHSAKDYSRLQEKRGLKTQPVYKGSKSDTAIICANLFKNSNGEHVLTLQEVKTDLMRQYTDINTKNDDCQAELVPSKGSERLLVTGSERNNNNDKKSVSVCDKKHESAKPATCPSAQTTADIPGGKGLSARRGRESPKLAVPKASAVVCSSQDSAARLKDKRSKLKPQMPVIAEDGGHVTDEEIRKTPNIIMGTNSLERKSQHWTNISGGSDGPRLPEGLLRINNMTGSNSISGFNTVTNAVSLLDAMHKKFYPKQYPHRSKAYSVDTIPKAPKMGTAVVHSKSAQFASDTIGGHSKLASDRYSDSNVQYRLSPNSPVSVLVTQRSHSLSPVSPAMRAGCHSGLSPQSCNRKQHTDSSHTHALEGALGRTSGGQSWNHWAPEEDQASTSEKIPASFNTEEAEIEALESCKWLRAAGFPQYAQMYEDGQFPVDITSVQKDHDFLDEDDIQALFRRLNILNRCATMKVEHPASKAEESDEDEQCALSDKWKYETKIQRWSRCDLPPPLLIQNGDITETGGIRSCSSHDSLLSDDEGASNQDSPPLLSRSHHMSLKVVDSGSGSSSHSPFPSPNMSSLSPSSSSTPKDGSHFVRSPRLVRAASERLKGAKNFLKRMESFKSKKKKKTYPPGHKLEIGDPVLVESPEVQARINQLGCVDLSPDVEDSPFLFPDQSRQRPYSGEDLPLSDSDASPVVEKRETVRGRNGKFSQNTEQSEHMTVQADYKPGSFPRILANGNVNLISGSERSYRTGSFEGDSAEAQHRQNVLRRTRSGTDEVRQPGERRAENRQSFYDNVPLGELDPQKELDLILQDLYKDISGLSQSLGESEKDSISDELTGPSEELQRIVFSLANQGDEDSIICLEPITKLDIPRDNQWTSTTSASSSSQQLKDVGQDSDFTDIQPSVQEDSVSNDRHNSLEELASEESHIKRTDREHEVSQCKVGLTDSSKTDMEVVSACGADFDPDHVSASSSNQESSEGDSGDRGEHRERRDSGVGSSLTRAPSDRKRRRIRWHSFMKSHRPSFNSRSLQISSMSASQMLMLQKYSLLKLTAIMEKHTSPARSGWNLNMPKFLKRTKTPDYTDRKLFGVPLLVILQRTGQPLPQCILYAMRCLRRTAMDAVGIFRKSGVRSRIQKLRDQLEVDPALVDFEALQSYDVADLFKQYFRELPECLLTNKLSETFTSIFISVPHNERLMAMQYAVIQLPDEHREVLHTLLLFLSDMAKHSSENQMNASNLAVCFAPSLFNMYGTRSPQTLSPKRTRKLTVGLPDPRELQEQKAAHECLTNMIENCKRIFTVPLESLGSSRLSAVDIDESVPLIIHKPSPDTEPVNYTAVMEAYIQELLKDARDKFRGWTALTSVNQVDIFYKKTSDSNPLRHWRVCTDIEAPPVEVLNKVLRERSTWDDDYLEGTCIERIGKQTEVYHWMVNSMAPHPAREYVELRHWQTDVSPKGASVLVSKSAEHPNAPSKGGVPGVVMASHYLIEPCGAGKSRVHHINRSDTRGRTPDWYNRAYGHFVANLLARVRESFKQGLSITNGPETKV